MKKFLVILSLIGSSAVHADDTSAYISLQSVILWRGIQFSAAGVPGVGGGVTYMHDSGLAVGVMMQNLTPPWGSELNHFLSYTFKKDDWSAYALIMRYYFPDYEASNRLGYRVGGSWQKLNAYVEYMPEFFYGVGGLARSPHQSSVTYVKAEYTHPINETLTVVPYVGYSMLSDPNHVGFDNYSDYSLAVRHQKKKEDLIVEVGWTGTNRKIWTSGPTTDKSSRKVSDNDDKPYLKISQAF